VKRLLAVIVVLAAWEAICRAGLVPQVILPAPSAIAGAAISSWRDYLQAFQVTAIEIITAILLAWLSGIVVGGLLGARRLSFAAFGPVLAGLFAVPLITWYPLFMTWFGLGSASKIAYGAVSGFFPVAIGTLNGVRNVDPTRILFGRAAGCGRLQLATRIILPSAIPSIVAGLRIGTALAVIGVIVSEMLASLDGLGYLISYNRTMFATGHVYLGIILALLCAVAANRGLSTVERRFMRWQEA
jgi:NitT/TauT family transport system permease protein